MHDFNPLDGLQHAVLYEFKYNLAKAKNSLKYLCLKTK